MVTSLEEWVPDGFHSYQGPGERRTHGAYADLDEANAAAEGVFYDKNPWGWQLVGVAVRRGGAARLGSVRRVAVVSGLPRHGALGGGDQGT